MGKYKTILVVGTFDTKNDELCYLSECIKSQNGNVLTMDVSVLGNSKTKCINLNSGLKIKINI